MALGAMARRRLPWQQPRKAAISRREVSDDKEMRRAVNDYKRGDLFEIVVIDRIHATKTYNLGEMARPLTIRCEGRGRLVATETDFPLFTIQSCTALTGLRLERVWVSDIRDFTAFDLYTTNQEVLNNTAPGTFLRLEAGALSLILRDCDIRTTDGTTTASGTLLDVASGADLDACVWSGDNVVFGDIDCVIENSRFIGVNFLDEPVTLANGSDDVQFVGCFQMGAVALEATTSRVQLDACSGVASVAIGSGSSNCVVSDCIGTGSGAVTATTSDGNTVTGNRNFTAYPTAGGTDVVADNA